MNMYLNDAYILKKTYTIRIICSLCLILSSIAIFTAYINPSRGYELSIYESTPAVTWIFLILSIVGAVLVIISQLYFFQYNNYCLLGITILLFNRIVLLSIPYIRGYYSWRGDNISHLGITKDILILGHITPDNSYPITHILLSELISITGSYPETIINYSTILFSLFYVISIYLLSTSVLLEKRAQLLSVTLISCVLFNGYDVYLMPNGWSILYLPTVFFFYFKSFGRNNSVQYKMLFVISLIMYPFFHPLSSSVIIFMLISIGFVDMLLILPNKWNLNSLIKDNSFPLTCTLIETTIFLPWILSFQQFNLNIKILYNSIITGSSPDVVAAMSDTLEKINLTGVDFAILFIKMMGSETIFLSLTLVCFILLVKSPNTKKRNKSLLQLIGIIFFIGLTYLAYLFSIIPGLQAINSQRLQAYLILFTPLAGGFVLNTFILKKTTIRWIKFFPIICIIILTASILSICSLYASPSVIRPTPSVTQMDIEGVNWYLSSKDPSLGNVYIMSPVYRFADGIWGTHKRKELLGSRYREIVLPDHFNYSFSNELGNSFMEDKYFLSTKFDVIIYDTVWKTVGRFNLIDFYMLEKDPTVSKLYSNGETHVYYIQSHVNQ